MDKDKDLNEMERLSCLSEKEISGETCVFMVTLTEGGN